MNSVSAPSWPQERPASSAARNTQGNSYPTFRHKTKYGNLRSFLHKRLLSWKPNVGLCQKHSILCFTEVRMLWINNEMKYRRTLMFLAFLFAGALYISYSYIYVAYRQYTMFQPIAEYMIAEPVALSPSIDIVPLVNNNSLLLNPARDSTTHFNLSLVKVDLDAYFLTLRGMIFKPSYLSAYYNDAFTYRNYNYSLNRAAFFNNKLYYAVTTGIYVSDLAGNDMEMHFYKYDFDSRPLKIEVSGEYLYVSTVEGVNSEGIIIDIHGISLMTMQESWVDRIYVSYMHIPILRPLQHADKRFYLVIDYSNVLRDIPTVEKDQYIYGQYNAVIEKQRYYSAAVEPKDDPYYRYNLYISNHKYTLEPAELKVIFPGAPLIDEPIAKNTLMSVLLKQYVDNGAIWFPLDYNYSYASLYNECQIIPGLVLIDDNRIILLDIESSVWLEEVGTYMHSIVAQEIVFDGVQVDSVRYKKVKVRPSTMAKSAVLLLGNKWYDLGNGMSICVRASIYTSAPIGPIIYIKNRKDYLMVSFYEILDLYYADYAVNNEN